MTKEQVEYMEFWCKLSQKANETQRDFNNLSLTNQQRISSEIATLLQAKSFREITMIINRFIQL
jgi:hypothetical protein